MPLGEIKPWLCRHDHSWRLMTPRLAWVRCIPYETLEMILRGERAYPIWMAVRWGET